MVEISECIGAAWKYPTHLRSEFRPYGIICPAKISAVRPGLSEKVVQLLQEERRGLWVGDADR